MKLDSEDYENIYLRIREKLWLFWASLIALFSGVGLVVLYFSLSAATEKAVNKYIQTETFQKNVIQATEGDGTQATHRRNRSQFKHFGEASSELGQAAYFYWGKWHRASGPIRQKVLHRKRHSKRWRIGKVSKRIYFAADCHPEYDRRYAWILR